MALINFYKSGNIWKLAGIDAVRAGYCSRLIDGENIVIYVPGRIIAKGKYSDYCDENGIAYSSVIAFFAATDEFFAGNVANIGPRKQTPTGNAMDVQIGPGDPISNIPVVMEFEHHQVHEGESYLAFHEQLSLGTTTVKYAITVPAGIMPHMVVSVDAYNGSSITRLFHTATYSGGSPITANNRNRNTTNTPGTTIKSGVTSTNGTQFESLLSGTGKSGGGSQRSVSEFILKAGSTYRVDIEGLDAGTKAIIRFYWYEDLGV